MSDASLEIDNCEKKGHSMIIIYIWKWKCGRYSKTVDVRKYFAIWVSHVLKCCEPIIYFILYTNIWSPSMVCVPIPSFTPSINTIFNGYGCKDCDNCVLNGNMWITHSAKIIAFQAFHMEDNWWLLLIPPPQFDD